ncbi:GNAT family N-acetyltransferase [Rhizobium populisoli]|uniref:GNAT family N-acetyltransferase n=1 Tax=Rhizobium populisoli TaxID=2859785 RepID=UPI0035E454CE
MGQRRSTNRICLCFSNDVQRRGHGTALFERLERLARLLGINELLVHSATDAAGFYQKLGFSPFVFDAGTFETVQMRKMIE